MKARARASITMARCDITGTDGTTVIAPLTSVSRALPLLSIVGGFPASSVSCVSVGSSVSVIVEPTGADGDSVTRRCPT